MASILKVHEQDTAIVEKRKGKRKVDDLNEDAQGDSDVLNKSPNKRKRNKQRVLLLSSRGITHRMRHLMNDLETLLPHVKKGVCAKMPPSHSCMSDYANSRMCCNGWDSCHYSQPNFFGPTGQIVEKDPQPHGPLEMSLVEIGPRLVPTPIRIF